MRIQKKKKFKNLSRIAQLGKAFTPSLAMTVGFTLKTTKIANNKALKLAWNVCVGHFDDTDVKNLIEPLAKGFYKWRLAEVRKRKAAGRSREHYQENRDTSTSNDVRVDGKVFWDHSISYCCFCRRKSKHGSDDLGSAGDDEMRVCIPENREKRKVEEIGQY